MLIDFIIINNVVNNEEQVNENKFWYLTYSQIIMKKLNLITTAILLQVKGKIYAYGNDLPTISNILDIKVNVL